MSFWKILSLSLLFLFFLFYLDPIAAQFYLKNPLYPTFFTWVSYLGITLLYVVLFLALFLLFLYQKNHSSATYVFNILFQLSFSILSSYLIKICIGRTRPTYLFLENFISFSPFTTNSHYHSMPSSHTITAFIVAFHLTQLFPYKKRFFLSSAYLIAFSRIVLGKHFLSDILIGMALSYLILNVTLKSKILNLLQNQLFTFSITLWKKTTGRSFDLPDKL